MTIPGSDTGSTRARPGIVVYPCVYTRSCHGK